MQNTETLLVISNLEAASQEALKDAFRTLSAYTHMRHSRTEQRSSGQVAAIERTEHVDAANVTLIDIDTLGTFTDDDDRKPTPVEELEKLAALILPDSPPYLAKRFMEAYIYKAQDDTLFWGRPTQIVDIQAHPERGTSQTITHARYYIDKATNDIVAISIERTDDSLLFAEHSRFYLRLRPGPNEAWVPFHIQIVSTLQLPLRPRRTVKTASTFFNIMS